MYAAKRLSRLHWCPTSCRHKEETQGSFFQRIYRPCFSLLMKQELETLDRLANPSKCLAALLLFVLISKRMRLAGLSEVINIRGHKVMLIEWAPHCNAQEISLHSESCSFQSHYPIPFSLVCFSYKPPWRSSTGAGCSHRQLYENRPCLKWMEEFSSSESSLGLSPNVKGCGGTGCSNKPMRWAKSKSLN